MRSLTLTREGDVSEQDVGIVDESRLSPGSYGVAGTQRAGEFASLEKNGYARHLKPGESAFLLPPNAYLNWQYAPLHRELSEHFVEAAFAKSNSMSLRVLENGSFTIGFCGKDRRHPYLEGTLTITADTSLASAQWRFHTSAPGEQAGGQVEFLAPQASSLPWLLIPYGGAFWRRISGHRSSFYAEASIYRAWEISAGAWP
jgi:hypothetical protein